MDNLVYYVLTSQDEFSSRRFANDLKTMLNSGWSIVPNTLLISGEYNRIVVLSRPNQVS